MKYLKNVLLATGLVATTLGMSLSANAGAIIQQDIYLDVAEFDAFPNGLGITDGMDQLIGSITYATRDADGAGEIFAEDVDLEINLGPVTLTEADLLTGPFPLAVLVLDDTSVTTGAALFVSDFEFDFAGLLYTATAIADRDFGGFFELSEEFFPVVFGETRLGNVTYVPEPSALILMLAGLGMLVRRKVAAK
ncbi:MAG: hypothetical protein Alis3KO_09270 [Aliiglaciecola sp.]